MQRRVSTVVVATTSTVVVAFVVPLCLLVSTLAEARAMAEVDQAARNGAIVVSGLHGQPELQRVVEGIDKGGVPVVEVLTPDQQRFGGTHSLNPDDPEVARARAGEAITVTDETGGRVLIPVVTEEGTYVVRATIQVPELRRGVAAAWIAIIGIGLLLILLSMLVARYVAGRISEPLRMVSATAQALHEGDLAARAEVTGTEETMELAAALNRLADRIVELLATERAAVADLSHRLRTPVTALRLDAEAVSEPEEAQRLQGHIEVLQRTIDAIVLEARRPVRTDLTGRSDVTATVCERIEFWRPLAEDQARSLEVDLPEAPLVVPMEAPDLSDLVDLLIDNVFAHTPEGTAFRVALTEDQAQAVLTVSDAGPGFGATTDEPRTGSTGLGLDIAARVTDRCGGSFGSGVSEMGGAYVTVRLPLVPV